MIEDNFKHLLLLLVIVLCLSDAAIIPQDESFKEFCKDVGGNLVLTTAVNNVITQGAKCQKATFGGIIVNDQEEAERNCKHYSPFHMTGATLDTDGFITCDYEALVICRAGFKQINGRCLRIENGRRSEVFSEAKKICDAMNLRLYRHNDERTAGFINLLFTDVSAIWATVDGNGVLFDVPHDSGPNYAIVYGTASIYNVGPKSLVKIPNDHYAMVMCEYTPKDTIMVLRSKIEMLSKYTHKAVIDGAFAAWRTFNHIWPDFNIHGTYFEYHQTYCKASMSALMNSANVRMFDTKITLMAKLSNRLGDSARYVAPFRYCRDNPEFWCSASSAWANPNEAMGGCWYDNIRYFLKGGYKQSPCHSCPVGETTYKGKGILMAYQSNGDYEFFGSFFRPSPMLCDVMFNAIGSYANCPSGWTQYVRPDGSRACHRHHTQKMTRDAARKYCVDNYSANLAGWYTAEELEIIIGFGQGWLSVKKNSACRYMSNNLGDACYREKTFYDPDDVSNDEGIQAMINRLYSSQPEGSAEYCMVPAFHTDVNIWYIHDWGCDASFAFTCTKMAEYQDAEIDYLGTRSD